jgi:glycosyltransferase involved in cell wall biosynthesis
MPLISVVMPVYNQEKYLAETIESVLGQTYKDFEFLILDDGSTDNSARIIREYARRDDRIVPYFEANSGRCEAANKLVARARGAWCAFLDADDVMLPFRLEKQLAFHQSNPEAAASSCHCYYINDQGSMLGEQRHPFLKSVADCKTVFGSNDFIQCAFTGLFISRKAFLQVDGLKKQYWPCDDFEFFNRLIDERYILVILQEALMKYRIHATSVTVNKPLHTYDVIGYVMECIRLRRAGRHEITFEAFLHTRAKDLWWVKLNRKRFNYSQIFLRNAGISIMSKRYLHFLGQILIASLLSPRIVTRKVYDLAYKN